MPYVTSLERLAADRGREEGREEGLAQGLKRGIKIAIKLKFEESGLQLISKVDDIDDFETLAALEAGLEDKLSLEALTALLSQD